MALEIEARPQGEGSVLELTGTLDAEGASVLLRRAEPLLRRRTAVTLDLAAVSRVDSAGAAALAECLLRSREHGASLTVHQLSPQARTALERTPAPSAAPPPPTERAGILERWGAQVVEVGGTLVRVLQFLAATSYWCLVAPLRGRFTPRGETVVQAVRIGVDALPIVGLIALLLGLIMSFQAAHQLRQFGANIFVADLVGVGMTRELGPLITAIVMAGRSGSAIAAELGTMVVGEEIAALRTMGINEMRFLVVPRMYAITLTQPAVTLLADLIGVAGGLLIGTLYLNLGATAYLHQTIQALTVGDLVTGLAKSVVFAWIIALVGCYFGLNIRGSAEGVGRATTASVVASIFLIIVADSVITTVTTLLG